MPHKLKTKLIANMFFLPVLFASVPAFAIFCPQCATEITQQFNNGELLVQTQRMAEQLTKLKEQLDQMKDQYNALTGNRGLGNILNDDKLKQYLPPEFKNVFDQYKHGKIKTITGDVNKIEDSIRNVPGETPYEQRQAILQRERQSKAVNKAIAMRAYDGTKKRLEQIEGLMSRINNTDDPKAIAELQARIATEQAVIQNESMKLKLLSMLQNAESELIEQQKQDRFRRIIDNSKTATPKLELKYGN